MDKIDIDKLPDDKFVNMKNRSQCDLMMIWLVPLLRYHVSCKDFCCTVQKKLFQTTMAKKHLIDNNGKNASHRQQCESCLSEILLSVLIEL